MNDLDLIDTLLERIAELERELSKLREHDDLVKLREQYRLSDERAR